MYRDEFIQVLLMYSKPTYLLMAIKLSGLHNQLKLILKKIEKNNKHYLSSSSVFGFPNTPNVLKRYFNYAQDFEPW